MWIALNDKWRQSERHNFSTAGLKTQLPISPQSPVWLILKKKKKKIHTFFNKDFIVSALESIGPSQLPKNTIYSKSYITWYQFSTLLSRGSVPWIQMKAMRIQLHRACSQTIQSLSASVIHISHLRIQNTTHAKPSVEM